MNGKFVRFLDFWIKKNYFLLKYHERWSGNFFTSPNELEAGGNNLYWS